MPRTALARRWSAGGYQPEPGGQAATVLKEPRVFADRRHQGGRALGAEAGDRPSVDGPGDGFGQSPHLGIVWSTRRSRWRSSSAVPAIPPGSGHSTRWRRLRASPRAPADAARPWGISMPYSSSNPRICSPGRCGAPRPNCASGEWPDILLLDTLDGYETAWSDLGPPRRSPRHRPRRSCGLHERA